MEHLGVVVEVWPLAADEIGIWLTSGRDALRSDRIPADSEPHDEVRYVLARDGVPSPLLLHSTSWRMDGPHLVVTYTAVLPCEGLVRSRFPKAPPLSPELPDAVGRPFPHDAADAPIPRYCDVLLHGVRHLRFLRDTDASAREALTGLWSEHLDGFESALAGMYE